jgi:hypothetical protein
VDLYKYVPVITAVEPSSGSHEGGEVVTVYGFGFSPVLNATTFKFGTTKAGSGFCFGTTINCNVVTPAHAVGTVEVKATVNKGTSAKTAADRFTYF